ncbi:MAG TPA: hypothetical protein VFI92_07205 [Steroidobacteraceae bacterium]|nr:hypothetical protein [Steroidobacteraceae bacterium]
MFRSFYLAGFECATGYNMHGEWIDQIAATEHDLHVDADYRRLADVGIRAVREAIRWPLVDRGDRHDFASVEPFVQAALDHGFDVIWDLFHYGYPDGLDPFSEHFADRFAAYCRAAARFIVQRMPGQCYFTPINEPSFFAWAGGDVARFAPHARGRAAELKVSLARAAIRGIDAIRDVCADARIVNVDPICRVVVDGDDPVQVEHAQRFNELYVFEFWDIVSGRRLPELGGSPTHLDIVGLNYYWTNQWALGREGVPLADDDPRRVPLANLVRTTWRRYGCEIIISETSALGDARAPWLHELSQMAEHLLGEGVPLGGICLYPILGMPEWHAREQWARMGLWDLEREQNVLQRKACGPMMSALRSVHARRGADLGRRERLLRLPRSGRNPMQLRGRLVWQRVRPQAHAIRVFRSNRRRGPWVMAVSLRAGERNVEHVLTANDLSSLLRHAEDSAPRELLAVHGIADASWSGDDDAAWCAHLKELADSAGQLEAPPSRKWEQSGDS